MVCLLYLKLSVNTCERLCVDDSLSLAATTATTSTNRQSTSSISILESQSKAEIENDIYFHRELLINSIEGRRIDLLTITSFHNIQKEHEYRFSDMFPDQMTKRCKKFKNKKVYTHMRTGGPKHEAFLQLIF